MYYLSYLASLCKRRRWPDPHFDVQMHPSGGYTCTVRVNHRDYSAESTDGYSTVELAREAAALRAYMITRNISASDNLYGQGAVPPALPSPGSQSSFDGVSVPNMAQPRYVPETQPLMYAGNGGQVSQAGISAQHMAGVGGVMVGHSQM